MHEIHEGKNSDYSDDSNPYSNFEGTAELTGLTTEQVFHVQLGNKMERLRQLMSGKEPNHESLDDTILDLAVYAALWGSWRNAPKSQDPQGWANTPLRWYPAHTVYPAYPDDDPVDGDYVILNVPSELPDPCDDPTCLYCAPRAEITD
jgi:hypothetical protein